MNCKPNDLARVVNSKFNQDRIVHCLRLATDRELLDAFDTYPFCMPDGPYWVVDPPIHWADTTKPGLDDRPYAPDSSLRPIRGAAGADETLAWAGLPEQREVTA